METTAAEWQRAVAAIGRGPVAATVYLETTAAEWQRAIAAIGRGPVVATVYLPLAAGASGLRGQAPSGV